MADNETPQNGAPAPAPAPAAPAPTPAPSPEPKPITFEGLEGEFMGEPESESEAAEIAAILNPTKKNIDAVSERSKAAAEPEVKPPPSPTPIPPVVPTPPAPALATPPAPTPEQSQNAALMRELANLQAQVAQLTQQRQTAQAPQGPQPIPQEFLPAPDVYKVEIPDQFARAFISDEAQLPTMKANLQNLVLAVGNMVHHNVIRQAVQIADKRIPDLVREQIATHQTQQTEAKKIFDDFYGKYPQLNKPELHQLVSNTAIQVGMQMGISQWNDYLRDATYARVVQVLTGVAPAPPTPSPAPAAPQAAAPASGQVPPVQFGMGGNTRPGKGSNSAQEADIRNTLGFF